MMTQHTTTILLFNTLVYSEDLRNIIHNFNTEVKYKTAETLTPISLSLTVCVGLIHMIPFMSNKVFLTVS